MAFVQVPNTAFVELVFTQHEQVVENTFYVEQATPFDLTSLQALADEFLGWWSAYMANRLSIDLTLIRIKATALDLSTSPAYETAVVADNVGTVNSSSQANNVTWTLRFTTALRGKSFRGRNYIPGIPGNAYEDNNVVSTAFANNMITAYEQLKILLDAEAWTHVVCSKWHNGEARLTGLTTPVVGYSYEDRYADSQRRRLPGRGI